MYPQNLNEAEPDQLVSTKVFAEKRLVKDTSVRSRYCITGSYFGVVPVKLPNGRLGWPVSVSGG